MNFSPAAFKILCFSLIVDSFIIICLIEVSGGQNLLEKFGPHVPGCPCLSPDLGSSQPPFL